MARAHRCTCGLMEDTIACARDFWSSRVRNRARYSWRKKGRTGDVESTPPQWTTETEGQSMYKLAQLGVVATVLGSNDVVCLDVSTGLATQIDVVQLAACCADTASTQGDPRVRHSLVHFPLSVLFEI